MVSENEIVGAPLAPTVTVYGPPAVPFAVSTMLSCPLAGTTGLLLFTVAEAPLGGSVTVRMPPCTGSLYGAPAAFAASDPTVVYDHAVAPGRHAVTVDIDRKDDREESFRTSQRNRFTVDIPRDHRVEVQVKIADDSTMGKDFPADKSGRYDMRVRVKAVAKPVGK